jgi:hypothetical protein
MRDREKDPVWGFNVGNGGWVKAVWRPDPKTPKARDVLVRMEPDGGGRLRIAELNIEDPTAEGLRSVRLSTIEAMLNTPHMRAEIEKRLHDEAPNLRAGYAPPGNAHTESPPPPRIRLQRPTGRALGEEFYRRVAAAYESAVAEGRMNPHVTLATDAGVPLETASRWIKTARRKHYLAPGEHGRAFVS